METGKEITPSDILPNAILDKLFEELEPLAENSNLSKSEAIARMAVDVLDDWRDRK